MAQQQYQMPQAPGRPYSPPQSTASPTGLQGFPLPPNKRQRLSPDPRSQPTSPYVQSPYAISPNAGGPHSTSASPHFSNISLPQNLYNTPYTNGHTSAAVSGQNNSSIHSSYQNPNKSPLHHQTQLQSQAPNGNSPHSNSLHNSQLQNNQVISQQGPGTMGPPSKPVDKLNEDQTDVLANAGIDLQFEENYAMSFTSASFKSQPNFSDPDPNPIGHAFTQDISADAVSFYGAGPANQSGNLIDKASQDEQHKKVADKAWADAALKLARSRQHELHRPHVNVAHVWVKMDRIARENGLVLNTDGGKMPQLKLPSEFQAEVRVQTAMGPQGAMTVTGGRFLPSDTALADQLALMSLATNLRIRALLEDAVALARGRRAGSQGIVPHEWADVSAPISGSSGTVIGDGTVRQGWESAVSPRTNPLKRSLSSTNRLPTPVSDGAKTPTGTTTYTGTLVATLRNIVEIDRTFEEARLLKRQNRLTGEGIPRTGSTVPGTPGSVAPETSIKPLTKKERERQERGKQNVADSHAQANATTQRFIFGANKKNKYSWMNGGGSGGSGTATPSRLNTQGLPGTPGASGALLEKQKLTADGSKKWGLHREDRKDQALQVEPRDLLSVLENDGKAAKTLQDLYVWIDNPKIRKP